MEAKVLRQEKKLQYLGIDAVASNSTQLLATNGGSQYQCSVIKCQ